MATIKAIAIIAILLEFYAAFVVAVKAIGADRLLSISQNMEDVSHRKALPDEAGEIRIRRFMLVPASLMLAGMFGMVFLPGYYRLLGVAAGLAGGIMTIQFLTWMVVPAALRFAVWVERAGKSELFAFLALCVAMPLQVLALIAL